MRRLARSLLSFTLAALAIGAPAARAGAPDSIFDLTPSGQHEPQLGAWGLASGIGRTDAVFALCGLPTARWLPVRAEALRTTARVFARAGLGAARMEAMIRQADAGYRAAHAQNPALPACAAMPPSQLIERQLHWWKDADAWGQAFASGKAL
jgi:hypothetical protein